MRYVNEGSKYSPNSNFMNRYASQKAAEEVVNEKFAEKEEFKAGYKSGTLRVATANKFMSLKNCGLDRYLEEDTNTIWKKEGDRIVRIADDLSWVDEFLKEEEK